MGRKKAHTPEEIVAKLRQVEVLTAQGKAVAEAARSIGVTEQLRDELLRAEVFNSLREAQVLIEQWRRHYNTARPHSSLGYRPPAPEVVTPALPMQPPRPGSAGAAPPPAAMLHSKSARTTRWGLASSGGLHPGAGRVRVEGFVHLRAIRRLP